MTTDLDLLDLAAKAMQHLRHPHFANYSVPDYQTELGICLELGGSPGAITSYWNPLTDDRAALRLAVALKIDLKFYADYVVAWFDGGFIGTGRIPYGDNPYAAVRRAIVLAAAEIGKVLP